ncbi:enoyl-CoA hydratase [Sphingomonas sp. TZW2008]|uniref:enoyl-CoA hydratase n=1 Tax=Sphingomonas sp. TZW2008 TaxID=1917973 RepID=UPI000A26D90A|nr:enoyl-CoA hydratase [Sphingomonas sp. TZW2008]
MSQVRYETPAPRVARIVLHRAEKRNAQGAAMTHALDDAFTRAARDDDVSVIILAAEGDHFCAGHDLSDGPLDPAAARGAWGDFGGAGWEAGYSRERALYLDITERWRNLPKPTIAAVQGIAIAGGVMLAWACDLIVCAEDARFRDNSAADMGVPGVELFHHPFELGVRKAKEWLFTGDWLAADEALRLGMVNHVVPRDALADFTLALAERIARTNRFTLKLAKESINAAQDRMGRADAMRTAFANHQLAHAHNQLVHGLPIDPSNLPSAIRTRMGRE